MSEEKLFWKKGDGMKPMIILPPNNMHSDAIKALRDNGLCVVISKNPSVVKFMDPIPCAMSRSRMEQAAIGLSRKILAGQHCDSYGNIDRKTILNIYIQLLVKGTSLDPEGSSEEHYQRVYDQAKRDETQRLAREDAKKEREVKRRAVLKEHPPKETGK